MTRTSSRSAALAVIATIPARGERDARVTDAA